MTHINLVGPRAFAIDMVWSYYQDLKWLGFGCFAAGQLLYWIKRLAESK